ncbi:hypothetical protein [Croceibacter atlanticus]|uniref:hypothetical protein n=1 Tax=Croceibacter atlanticus TaxID=313588 RepID=UPI00248FB10A|nr:hypothetical protein [Croceibacter atlanticus]
MKKLLLIYILLLSTITFAQKVTVKGIALDSTNGRNKVYITLNDTINKYLKNKDFDMDKYESLYDNKNFNTKVNNQNRFKIKAKLSDSLTFSSWRHITKSYLVSDLKSKKDIKIVLEPQVCEEYVPCKEENPKLYVFIGEKIKVDYAKRKYYCNRVSMDSKFDAKYKIVENLYGNFMNDTINYVAYDHYGKPGFSEYDNVILYVAEYCGELYHVKYQYNNVYKTKNGKWASPYQGFDYKKLDSLNIKRPIKMEFEKEVTFEYGKHTDTLWFEKRFPKPFYKTNGFKAKAVYGNYAIDIFEIMKKTILKTRGFFE